jgi:hypothetical protein
VNRRVWIVGPNGDINPGLYRAQLERGGRFVPVRCWIEAGDRDPDTGELLSDELTYLEVDGRRVDPFAPGYFLMGEPVGQQEFNAMSKEPARQEPSAAFDPTRHPSPF